MNLIQDTLCPDIWKDAQMDAEVREKLLDIGKRFYTYLKVDAPVIDIILTGSLANYNWTDKSDLDVHIIIDYTQVSTPELSLNLFQTKKALWNKLRKSVRVKGFPVELYAQDIAEDHRATGQFSLLNNKWLVIPEKVEVAYNVEKAAQLTELFENSIEKISRLIDTEEKYLKAVELKDAVLKLRRSSIDAAGEFALGNIVFKRLRNNGSLERLFDIISKCYDHKLSLWELKEIKGQLLHENFTAADERQIRIWIRQELEAIMKKGSVTDEAAVREIVRGMLKNMHRWMWDKTGIWLNQI